jgi:hypothetical protein
VLKKFDNILDKRCFAGTSYDKVAYTYDRDFEFMLFEESLLIKTAAGFHKEAVQGRKWSAQKEETFQPGACFSCHDFKLSWAGRIVSHSSAKA